MQRPWRNDRATLLARGGEHRRVEAALHPAPARHRRRAGCRENEIAGLRPYARDQLAHQRRERHDVCPAIFRSATRDVPSCAVIAQFVARHAGNFVPPLAGQQQYPEQRSERARSAGCQRRVDGFACPPKPADFVGGQHAIARLRPRGPVDTRTRIALDAALTLEPAEHAREGGKERAPAAVGYVAIARRDAGYSDPPGLIDHAPDVVGVDAGDRPVGPALREAALGLFGFPITMVAQTQQPSGLKPIPRLRPGVLGDVSAHAGAERISGSLLDLGALAMPTRSMVGDDVVAESAIAVHRRRPLARRLERQRLPDLRISHQLAARSVERPQGNLAGPAVRSAKPHLPGLVTAWLDDEELRAAASRIRRRFGPDTNLRHAASVRILTTVWLPGCTQGARQRLLCPVTPCA